MAKSKPVNFYFRLEAGAWYAFAGGLRLLGVENAAALGAAVVPVIGSLTSAHKTSLRNIRHVLSQRKREMASRPARRGAAGGRAHVG